MRVAVLAGLVAVTLAGGAEAQEILTPTPRLQVSGSGDGILFYNQFSADCVTLEHGFGRNSVWGRWRLPLDRIGPGEVEEGAEGVLLRFRCIDGAACISGRARSASTDMIDSHEIPFGDVQRARAFAMRVIGHKVACGLT